MGKWIAIGLVGAIVATLASMQLFMFDRSLGKAKLAAADNAVITPSAATPVASANPLDNLKKSVEDAGKTAIKQAADGASKAVTQALTGMVAPEDLPNGFILVVTDKSRKASQASPIFMPSSHNGWDPGDKAMQLIPGSDMKWRIEWEKPTLSGRIAFKFTRGSWESVETTSAFKQIENRLLPQVDISKVTPGQKAIIELEIENWDDNKPEDPNARFANRFRPIDVAAGSVKRVQVVGGANPALQRELIVWLPPGYDAPENAARTYPVLYMNDGQNVFEKVPGINAEWGADETASKLIASGTIEPLIIVAVPNAGPLRNAEYLPFAISQLKDTKPLAGNYVDFLVREVVPKINRGFRVKSGPEHSAIGGASLGGIIALEAATRHPEVFGVVLAESSPLTTDSNTGFKHFAKAPTFPSRLYFGMGGKEVPDAARAAEFAASAEAFGELARGKGIAAANLKVALDPASEHNEAAWAKRLGPALEFLFPKK
jgi:predicted alpha/beta superfamily hydrolase